MEVEKEMLEDVKLMVATSVEDKYVSDPGDNFLNGRNHEVDYVWDDSRIIRTVGESEDLEKNLEVQGSDHSNYPKLQTSDDGSLHPNEVLPSNEEGSKDDSFHSNEVLEDRNSNKEEHQERDSHVSIEKHVESADFLRESREHQQGDPSSTGVDSSEPAAGRLSESSEPLPIPHSGLIPLSGPLHRSTQSGPIPYSGNLSLRSDSSTTSTRSFAFPVLTTFEWNSSPAKMAPPDKRFLRRRSWWWRWMCCACESSAAYH